MQEWIDAVLTWQWLLGFSMALAFKNLGAAVSQRLRDAMSTDKE